jgi:hypothetical protein
MSFSSGYVTSRDIADSEKETQMLFQDEAELTYIR